MAATYKKTGRNTVLYATKWTQASDIDPEFLSITDEDIQGLMEVIHGLKGPNLQAVPAQAILDQFELAKSECEDPKKLGLWLPILSQYGPACIINPMS